MNLSDIGRVNPITLHHYPPEYYYSNGLTGQHC